MSVLISKEELWKREHLVKKRPKPIANVFKYNPERVIKAVKFQTGVSKNALKDDRKRALLPGKRISKNGKIYYEYRANHSDLDGKVKNLN